MKGRLESAAMLSFVIHAMIGIRLLTLPRDVIKYANNNGWISILIVGTISYGTAYAFYWLSIKHQGLNLAEIHEKVFGKLLGKIANIGVSIYVIAELGITLRLFADSINLFLLEKTPSTVIIGTMLLVSMFCLKKDIKTVSIVLDILTPTTLLVVVILMILSTFNLDYKNILPVFYGGITPIIKGGLQAIDPIVGVGIVAFVMPYFTEPKKTLKWITIGFTLSIAVYLLIILLCILMFGSEETHFLLFPALTLSRSIGSVKAEIFERAESLFLLAWIPITFTTIVIYYLASVLSLKTLFNSKKDDLFIYGLIPVIFIMALIPKNIVEVFKYLQYNSFLAIALNFIQLPILIAVAAWKQRGEKNDSP